MFFSKLFFEDGKKARFLGGGGLVNTFTTRGTNLKLTRSLITGASTYEKSIILQIIDFRMFPNLSTLNMHSIMKLSFKGLFYIQTVFPCAKYFSLNEVSLSGFDSH